MNKTSKIIFILLSVFLPILLVFSLSTFANDYYVDDGGSDVTGNGSQGNPWKTITHSISQISQIPDGTHTLHVASGTYNKALGETFPINLKNNLTIQGDDVATCIVEGPGETKGGYAADSVFYIGTGLSGWKIDSLTIKGMGSTTLDSGITVVLGSNYTISNNIIDGQGTGFGGIYPYKGDGATINNNLIMNMSGAGVYLWSEGDWSKNITIKNNTIYNCSYGISNMSEDDSYKAYARNNIIYGSYLGLASQVGGNLFSSYNCISNASGASYYNVDAGSGDITSDPLFANLAGGDFHLKSMKGRYSNGSWVIDSEHSPCIDAGNPSDSVGSEPEPNGSRINMGAYGGTSQASKSLGLLTNTNVEPVSLAAGARGDVTITFTTENSLPSDGKIYIDFPSGFNAQGCDTVTAISGIDGNFSVAVSNGDGANDIVTITRSGGTEVSGSTGVSFRINNVRNPLFSGSTGVYLIRTLTAENAGIDQDANVSSDTITGSSTTMYVNSATGVDDYNHGNSASNPYKTISFAVNNASSGFTINVAAGTYNEASGESFPIGGSGGISNLTIIGAGAGRSIIECDGSNNGFNLYQGCNISGFTVVQSGGSGISAFGFSGNVETFPNNIISDCVVYGSNESLSVGFGSLSSMNQGNYIKNCIVYNVDIGVASTNYSVFLLSNCVFYNCGTDTGSLKSAFFTENNGVILAMNSIVHSCENGFNPQLSFYDSSAYNYFYNVTNPYGSEPSWVADKTGDVVGTNPLFVSLDPNNDSFMKLSSTANGQEANSPCIDAGINEKSFLGGAVTITAPSADIIGTARPQGSAVDIGVYEYRPSAYNTSTSDGISGYTDSNYNLLSPAILTPGTSAIYLQLKDLDENLDPNSIDEVSVTSGKFVFTVIRAGTIVDTEDATGISGFVMRETGADTGIFRLVTPLDITNSITATSGNGKIEGTDGDVLRLTYTDSDPIYFDAFIGIPFTLTKDANKEKATVGDIITYTLTIQNNASLAADNVTVVDTLPPGFKYVSGTASLNNAKISDPTGTGRTKTFSLGTINASTTYKLRYRVVIGSGVGQGSYTNSAVCIRSSDNATLSNVAREEVKIIPNPLFYTATIIGKVFVDKNQNQIQDSDENGLSDVKLCVETGLCVKTDSYGRFHLENLKPQTHIIGLDTKTLPKGSKLTSENPIVLTPVTEGLPLQADFGVFIKEKEDKK